MATIARFHSARSLAKATGLSAKTVHRIAKREHWPSRQIGNRFEFIAPRSLLGQNRAALEAASVDFLQAIPAPERYRFRRASLRFEALLELRRLVDSGTPKERALAEVARAHSFSVSPSSLRSWAYAYSLRGRSGLEEQKLGNVGRKARAHRRAK
jgi:hypothetical protein